MNEININLAESEEVFAAAVAVDENKINNNVLRLRGDGIVLRMALTNDELNNLRGALEGRVS